MNVVLIRFHVFKLFHFFRKKISLLFVFRLNFIFYWHHTRFLHRTLARRIWEWVMAQTVNSSTWSCGFNPHGYHAYHSFSGASQSRLWNFDIHAHKILRFIWNFLWVSGNHDMLVAPKSLAGFTYIRMARLNCDSNSGF